MNPVKRKKQKPVKNKCKSVFAAQLNCPCQRKCSDRVDVISQREIFETFKELQSKSAKVKYLRSIVKRNVVKENIDPIISIKKKEFHSEYILTNDVGQGEKVCLTFLSKLLGISPKKVYRAASTIESNPEGIDRRGKFPRSSNYRDIDFLKNFIAKFTTYESHYSSPRSITKYLHPRLNQRKMYRLYCDTCQFKQRKVLSEHIFRKHFRNDFDFKFVKLSKQACKTCSVYGKSKQHSVRSVELNHQIEMKQKQHVDAAKEIKNNFIETVNFAKESVNRTEVFTFKMRRPFELPYLQEDDVYFKKLLWFHSFCIYDEVRNKPYIYVWNETSRYP